MTTLIAALIGAGAALAVMVIDRAWSARVQRRAERRQIYARFLGACWGARGLDKQIALSTALALQRGLAVGERFAEVELIAPSEVRKAGERLALFTWNTQGAAADFISLREAFVAAARRDLGERG